MAKSTQKYFELWILLILVGSTIGTLVTQFVGLNLTGMPVLDGAFVAIVSAGILYFIYRAVVK